MIEVAKYVNADKVERLLAERAAKQSKIEEQIEQVIPKEPNQQAKTQQPQPIKIQSTQSIQSMQQANQSKPTASGVNHNTNNGENISDSDKIRINEGKRDIDVHNQIFFPVHL